MYNVTGVGSTLFLAAIWMIYLKWRYSYFSHWNQTWQWDLKLFRCLSVSASQGREALICGRHLSPLRLLPTGRVAVSMARSLSSTGLLSLGIQEGRGSLHGACEVDCLKGCSCWTIVSKREGKYWRDLLAFPSKRGMWFILTAGLLRAFGNFWAVETDVLLLLCLCIWFFDFLVYFFFQCLQ